MTEPEVIDPIRDAERPGCEVCRYGVEEDQMITKSLRELEKERPDFDPGATDARELHLCRNCERILPTEMFSRSH
jgi:hypothetical protein